jgi:ubiquitin carboxyl-terminal hydrolase 4/11/15
VQWVEGAFDAAADAQAEAEEAPKGASSGELTVRECLRAFSLPEVLSPDNEWYCSDCKQHKRATKTLSVYTLPDLLIIHLKRFHYQGDFREKIETQVGFPLDGLDLSEFCQNRAGAAAQEEGKEPMLYDCYGVSKHMGGMGGGHYNAYVRNLATGDW